ncbi:hypothetical protein ACFL5K_03515 [Gemmatimonadota bacterium]
MTKILQLYFLLLFVPSIAFSQAITISNRFILDKIDGLTLSQAPAKVQSLLSADGIIKFNADYFGERTYYPWESLQNSKVKNVGYRDEKEVGSTFTVIKLNSREWEQLLNLMSPFMIDYHLRSHHCYADSLMHFLDNLGTFPLVDSLTYRKYYSGEPIGLNSMRIYADNHQRERSSLIQQHQRLIEANSIQPNDIRQYEANLQVVDQYENRIYSHLIHKLMFEEVSRIEKSFQAEDSVPNSEDMDSTLVPKDSLTDVQRLVLDTYNLCRAFRNNNIFLRPFLFPAELITDRDGISHTISLYSANIVSIQNQYSIIARTSSSKNFVFTVNLPFFKDLHRGVQTLTVPSFTNFSILRESSNVMNSGMVPPSYFLPQNQRVTVVSIPGFDGRDLDVPQDFAGWNFPVEMRFPHKPWAPENDTFIARVISVQGFWDADNFKLYMENKPLDPGKPRLFPEIYYRISKPQDVIIKPSLNVNPKTMGLSVETNNFYKQFDVPDNKSIKQISWTAPRNDQLYADDILIGSESENQTIVYGVKIIYTNYYSLEFSRNDLPGSIVDRNSPNIHLEGYFFPGWIREVSIWVGSEQNPTEANPNPLKLKITLRGFENRENLQWSLLNLTRVRAKEMLSQEIQLPHDEKTGLPFVTVYALIPD